MFPSLRKRRKATFREQQHRPPRTQQRMWLVAPYVLLLGMLGMPHSHAAPCAVGVDARVVSSTAEASNFSEALLCSGAGQFEVEWSGDVLLEQPIIINGSYVKITGVGPGEAVIDGGGSVSLFDVYGGSTLELHALSLVGGWRNGSGGGLALFGFEDEPCRLTASNCSFIGNTAEYGGTTRV